MDSLLSKLLQVADKSMLWTHVGAEAIHRLSGDPSSEPKRELKIGFHRLEGWKGEALEFLLDQTVGDRSVLLGGAPDPSYHWALHVGDFYYELHRDAANNHISYKRGRLDDGTVWKTYSVGFTISKDDDIDRAGESCKSLPLTSLFLNNFNHMLGSKTIDDMPEEYGLRSNNCQSFVIRLLNVIALPGRTKVTTTFAVRAGILNLQSASKEGEEVDIDAREKMLVDAMQTMDQETPKLVQIK